jgi:hypothetical protein
MKIPKILALVAILFGGLQIQSVKAQNPNFTDGNLVLYFQQYGGSQTIMVSLGAGTLYRDATSSILNIVDLGSILNSTYAAVNNGGVSWFDNSTIYFGIAGVRSNSTNTTTQVNGDPNRTIYISQARQAVGVLGSASGNGWTGFTNSDMTSSSTDIIQLQNVYKTQFTTLIAVSPNSSSYVDDTNPFLGASQSTGFSIFDGGVQFQFGSGAFGTLGGVNAEGALDLYRILASTSASGQVAGPLRDGTYEGTFVINSSGQISYLNVPEPSSAVLLGSALLLTGFVRRRQAMA